MSEASARMHLREHVRGDDIDLAIRVSVGSFISAQKISIRRQLERGFRKYIRASTDHDELLAFVLGQIAKERYRYYHFKHKSAPKQITIKITELEERAKELEVYDIHPFFSSAVFKTNGYTLDSSRTNIIKSFSDTESL